MSLYIQQAIILQGKDVKII